MVVIKVDPHKRTRTAAALDRATQRRLDALTVEASGGVPWPPGRNHRCWRASGTKYKRCCGRP